MARKFKKAFATYNGGKSYQFRGVTFKQGRAVPIHDERLAKALDSKKGMSVQFEYTEVEVEDTKPVGPVVCSNCGVTVPTGFQFCGSCGCKLNDAKSASVDAPAKPVKAVAKPVKRAAPKPVKRTRKSNR